MNALDSETFLSRITMALNKPIQSRCAELTVLFERGNIKDLQHLFPLLIDNIFGPQGTMAWGLRTITTNLKPHDFCILQLFFSPMGPLFKVIYALLKDPLIKYDFSITYLPAKIRQLLEAGSVHPFYSDLVHVSPQNKQIVSLSLNPFDYYMFHFAYHLINPWHQRSDIALGSSWNTVYYILCCDYVLHFFPTELVPVQPLVGVGGKLTLVQSPTFAHQLSSPTHPASKLLKKDFFTDPMGEYSKLHPPLDKHPRAEIWRSESVLTIFLDMWLNNDQVSQPQENFNMNITTKRSLYINEVPAGEYVRIIRALVKQLHAFAASLKIDDGHMAELKKITLPIMQGKMYVFLRNLIHKWPLDGSFRLVLELWLSFIQPWRYASTLQIQKRRQPDLNLDADDLNPTTTKHVDREYLSFIAENILAYVVIFQQLLPRFLRVDLSSPKNSLMLYRLAKVFDQPNLVSFIKEIEECIEENNISPSHNYTLTSNAMPPLSPTLKWSSNRNYYPSVGSSQSAIVIENLGKSDLLERDKAVSTKYAVIVRQKILELEGTNFCYKPLFATLPAPEVYELLKYIARAKKIAINVIELHTSEVKRRKGFLGFFKHLFLQLDSFGDEFSLEDRKKVPGYLDFTTQYLCDIFHISESVISESFRSMDNICETSREKDDNSISKLLTPQKVRQRIGSFRYEGNPDLYPIGTYEVTILVRMFYHLATQINEQFGSKIRKLYKNPTYLGKLFRQVISPPITIFKYDKSHFGQPRRVAERLPPRISLRYFATYQFLVYISIGVLISTLLHYSIPTFLMFVFSCWFCVICVKALFDKSEIQCCPNPLGNMSSDRSF